MHTAIAVMIAGALVREGMMTIERIHIISYRGRD
jgi:hypothetical protein